MVSPSLEDALFCWVCEKKNGAIMLNIAKVGHHAERLLKDVSCLLPDDGQIVMKVSKCVLEWF